MPNDRERFAPGELAVVLSHYDLGVIHSAKEFPRGSRKSPKLLLQTAGGNFLLKRRAKGRSDPYKVAFAHALLGHLIRRRFPVPEMIGTRDDNNSILQLDREIYELFEFVDGESYNRSLEHTTHAGKTLAGYHDAVADFETDWTPPAGVFHDSPSVRQGLNAIPTTTASHDSVVGHEAALLTATQELYERYDEAAEAVNALGFAQWPVAIIHGDWHPGNMLFRRNKVVAVLDFDSARRLPRVVDLANGMLQFSILRGRSAPSKWPDYFDETRMRRFLLGYGARIQLDADQRRAIPHLMIESLIAESVVPIAATGSFGRMPGYGVLQMVRRKVRWLMDNTAQLEHWILE
ncbi:MAG: phosphotransferase [Planctomycetes bacterium]|nr:phosphotransferase [Planctomycetota bacterium]